MKCKLRLLFVAFLMLLASCASSNPSLPSSMFSSSTSSSGASSTTSTSSTHATSTTSSSSNSETSSQLVTLPEFTAVNDTYDIDNPLDITFVLDPKEFVFEQLLGFGIQSDDYAITSNLLTIHSSYLKYFATPGEYLLYAKFSTNTIVDLVFKIEFNNHENRVINQGFETGDYFGWNGYQVWKDEAGLFSYRPERIITSSFYGAANTHPYHQEGQYHLGVYQTPYDNGNKDLNQERMGMLRSQDFRLGGTGWISFRLGGGQNMGTTYLSIKETTTNIELARFGNRHFGNTTISETNNAEAFMFQYYADLSSLIGKTMYALLIDGASHEWNVLSFDSFETYYETVPAMTPNQRAIDIKPNIYGIAEAPNHIVSPLTTSITNWEDPQQIFNFTDGRARTNRIKGDADLGVVRSPAFKVDHSSRNVLVWEWEGALRLDKQIFISIKEAMTNLEILRLTRRDNLATKESGGMDKHWYSLEQLNPEKQYYLELVDNANSSWGLISVRNFELVTSDDVRLQVTTDEAVNAYYGHARVDFITGGTRTPSDFSYQPITSVFKEMVTFGSEATDEVIIGYSTNSKHTWIEVEDIECPDQNPEKFSYQNNDIYRVMIKNLTGRNQFRYRIGEYGNGGFWQTVKMPNQNQIQFIFNADSQSNTLKEAQILNDLIVAARTNYTDTSFVLATGDIVEQGGNSKMWEWFFEANPWRASLPYLGIPGNHDYYGSDGQWQSNAAFEANITTPQNGPIGYSSYFVKLGKTLFIMLDAVDATFGISQQSWLQEVVTNFREGLVIVGTHYSAYGAYHETTSSDFRATWSPIFEQLNVDLVLSGHDHLFTRTPQMREGIINREDGVIYITGGSASSKIYDIPSDKLALYDGLLIEKINVVTIITISNESLMTETIDRFGNVYDSLNLMIG